jgi:hypothetical protein
VHLTGRVTCWFAPNDHQVKDPVVR